MVVSVPALARPPALSGGALLSPLSGGALLCPAIERAGGLGDVSALGQLQTSSGAAGRGSHPCQHVSQNDIDADRPPFRRRSGGRPKVSRLPAVLALPNLR